MIRRVAVAALGVAAVLPMALALWGFMVDDALITGRYAANLANGHGYRFNASGPSTDGVTPLGFAYLLAPFARAGPMAAYRAAKLLGLVATCVSGALVALAIHRIDGSRARWFGLVLLATSVPLGAWAVAGMETGLVAGLAGVAAAARVLGWERAATVSAAVVAGLRPEAVPWAVALALGPQRFPPEGLWRSRWLRLAVVSVPPAGVALTRLWVFGHATPLGAIAKPSTVDLGARYALACAILCGLIAMAGLRAVPAWARGLQVAVLAHWLAMAAAGGDWMPVSRLATTALPSLALAAAAVAARPRGAGPWLDRGLDGLRVVLALAGQLFVLVTQGPKLRAVEAARVTLMRALEAPLGQAKVVATLDIGWVGASTQATVVDLAGVTDPAVATLPGSHTEKRIPPWFFAARGVDTLVLRLRPGEALREPFYTSRFATFVDMWTATTPDVAEGFEVVAEHHDPLHYLVLRQKAP